MYATLDTPTDISPRQGSDPSLVAVVRGLTNAATLTSTHEAGHGCLAVLLGVRFTELRALGDGSGWLRSSPEQVLAGRDDAAIAAGILVSAAGPAAHAMLGLGDWRRAAECASHNDREVIRLGREFMAEHYPHHPLSPCSYVDALSIIIQPGVTAAIMDTAKLLAHLGAVSEATVAHIVRDRVEQFDPDNAEVRLANVRRVLNEVGGKS